MKIQRRKVEGAILSTQERQNLNVLEESILKLEKKEEFMNTIGAEVVQMKTGSYLIISAFSSSHLSQFITALLADLRNEDLKVAYSNKNAEHMWAPVWSNKIKLDAND